MVHIEFDLNWIEILKTAGYLVLGLIVGILTMVFIIGKPY